MRPLRQTGEEDPSSPSLGVTGMGRTWARMEQGYMGGWQTSRGCLWG